MQVIEQVCTDRIADHVSANRQPNIARSAKLSLYLCVTILRFWLALCVTILLFWLFSDEQANDLRRGYVAEFVWDILNKKRIDELSERPSLCISPIGAFEQEVETGIFIMPSNEAKFILDRVARSNVPNVMQERRKTDETLLCLTQISRAMVRTFLFFLAVVPDSFDHPLNNVKSAQGMFDSLMCCAAIYQMGEP